MRKFRRKSGAVVTQLSGYEVELLTSLVNQLVKSITLADLSRGQLIEILSNIGQSTSGSVEDLRSRVAAAASQRQSARGRSLTGSRW